MSNCTDHVAPARTLAAKRPPWRFMVPSRIIDAYLLKSFKPPARGWNAQTFATHGRGLIVAIHRRAKLAQRKAVPHVAKTAQEIFVRQIDKVVQKATGIICGRRSVWLDLILPEHEAIWASAFQEVFGTEDFEIQLDLVPPIQSVMGQAYSQTAELMAVEPDQQGRSRLSREAQGIAQKITGINDTTKRQMEKIVRDSIEDGLTITETAHRMREELPDKNRGRAMTIARTEMNNAWSQGSMEAFRMSPTLTHLSVIGCEAREPGSPQYRGESTCNIEDVPVADVESIEFHPNHTGTWIPSRFRED